MSNERSEKKISFYFISFAPYQLGLCWHRRRRHRHRRRQSSSDRARYASRLCLIFMGSVTFFEGLEITTYARIILLLEFRRTRNTNGDMLCRFASKKANEFVFNHFEMFSNVCTHRSTILWRLSRSLSLCTRARVCVGGELNITCASTYKQLHIILTVAARKILIYI